MLKDLQAIKDFLTSRLTPESKKEEIEEIGKITALVDSVDNSISEKDRELIEVKDMLIKSMKNEGSKTQAKEVTESDKPKSLEDIAKDLIAKDK